MIRGIHLVSAQFGADGKPIQYRIEPKDGITDPAKHVGPARLVQEDALFYAVATGLGAFGVAYSVTISTVPFYWIRETRELTTWSAAKTLLQQGPTGDVLNHHNAEVWISPYTSDALITRRDSVPAPEASQLAGPNDNPFVRLMSELPALREVAAEIQGDGIPDELSAIAGAVLAAFLKNFPLLVPPVSALKFIAC